jgi:hypothetical protein
MIRKVSRLTRRWRKRTSRWGAWLFPAVFSFLLLTSCITAQAQGGDQKLIGRPAADEWNSFLRRMEAARQLPDGEDKADRFVKIAQAIEANLKFQAENWEGVIRPPGDPGSNPIIFTYYPRLAVGYCYWVAARLTTSRDRQILYYRKTFDALAVSGALTAQTGSGRSRRAILSRIYETPLIRRMVIASGLLLRQNRDVVDSQSARDLLLEWARIRQQDNERSQNEEARQFVDLKAIEVLRGREIARIRLETEEQIKLFRTPPRFKPIQEPDLWKADVSEKRVTGAIEGLIPVTVAARDVKSKEVLAQQDEVTGAFNFSFTLNQGEERDVELVMLGEDPVDGKFEIKYPEKTFRFENLAAAIVEGDDPPMIADREVEGLQFRVRRLRKEDVVIVQQPGAAGDPIFRQEAQEAGDALFTVPKFLVDPNRETPIRISVRRRDRDVGEKVLTVRSETRPIVTGAILKLNDQVSVVRVEVADYAAIQQMLVDGIRYPVKPEIIRAAGQRDRNVYLVPILANGRSAVTVTARNSQGRDSGSVTVRLPERPETISADDPKLRGQVGGIIGLETLAQGNIRQAIEPYIQAQDGDPSRREEAEKTLREMFEYVLRFETVPNDPKEDVERLEATRALARAVGREADLTQRIVNAGKNVAVRIRGVKTAFSPQTRLAWVQFEVTGLTSTATIKRVISGITLRDSQAIPVPAGALSRLVSQSGDTARIQLLLVAAPNIESLQVEVAVSENNTPLRPASATVNLSDAGTFSAAGQLPDRLQSDFAALENPRAVKLSGDSMWLQPYAARRMRQLADESLQAAGANLAQVRSMNRQKETVQRTYESIQRAREDKQRLAEMTGQQADTADLDRLMSALVDALQPEIQIFYNKQQQQDTLFRDPTTGALVNAEIVVYTWGEKVRVVDSAEMSVGAEELTGNRRGVRFNLERKPMPGQALKLVAEVSDIPGMPLRIEKTVNVQTLVKDSEARFNPPSVETSAVIDDATGTNGSEISLSFNAPKARGIAWKVLDKSGKEVLAEQVQTLSSAEGKLTIPKGALRPGAYRVVAQVWDTERREDCRPSSGEYSFRVVGLGVAFVVGIDYYSLESGQKLLRHPADDARAFRQKLLDLGYDPKNILFLSSEYKAESDEQGRITSVSPKLVTNALSETLEEQALGGRSADNPTLEQAFSRFQKLIKQRKARHAILFFAGHGKNGKGKEGRVAQDWFIASDGGEIQAIYWTQETLLTMAGVRMREGEGGGKDSLPVVIGLFDACRSVEAGFGRAELSTAVDKTVFQQVASCLPGQQSNEDLSDVANKEYSLGINHGFFTYSLLTSIDELRKGQRPLTLGNVIADASARLQQLVNRAKEKQANLPDKPYQAQELKQVAGDPANLNLVYQPRN